MNALAPPFPTNPAVGQRYGNWVWSGVQWVCSPTTGIQVLTQVFTASGPYMPSPGLVSCVVECIGGGGGGGAANTAAATQLGGAGGGGAGGYMKKTLPAALVLGGVNVTVGTGGLGVTDPSTGGAYQSFPGTPTSFGALCVANGGFGGQANTSEVSWGDPGDGGAGVVGDFGATGNPGFPGSSLSLGSGTPAELQVMGGYGGAGFFGGGAQALLCPPGDSIAGVNGGGWGSGGSGGSVNQILNTAGVAGGQGAGGICVVTEFCWADGATDDCLNPPIKVDARVAVTQVPWPGPGPCPPGWGQGGYDYEGDG